MNDSSVAQYKFNMPTALKNRLQEAAESAGRSLSSEIIIRLQASLSLADDKGFDFTPEGIERMILEVVISGTEELEARVKLLERHVDTTNHWQD